ncbi:MAG: metallophosphoesterase [Anaerolineae bacterium]|nr:metallophosphoesterase [Anaerolineae bacterium]
MKESRRITWLHISDLHLRSSRAYDANVVLKALLRDVSERIEQDGLRPDFVAVTGDLAFSGKPAEYELVRQFLDELLRVTGLDKGRLFLAPGNHDVDRSLITRGAQAIGDGLTDRDSANDVLATPADRQLMMARFRGYKAFVNGYLAGRLLFDEERYFYVRSLDLAGLRVAIMGLNSAWLSASVEDRAKGLLIGERQARAALDAADKAGAAIKIALLHHPLDWLREFDQEDSGAILADGCHFILHGHLHHTAATQLATPDGAATVLAGGACYETRQYANTYNWVQLNLAAGSGLVILRRYSDARGGFWAKDTLTYRNAPDGVYRFRLPAALQGPQEPPGQAPAGSPKDEYQRIERRIDAAVPNPIEVGQHIKLLVQVRFPDSPYLDIEDWPGKLKPSSIERATEGVSLDFLIDDETGKLAPSRLEIEIVAPDFKIDGSARQVVEVPPDEFSKCVSFPLTARKEGLCTIDIQVRRMDHVYLGTIPVEITVGQLVIPQTKSVASLILVVIVCEPPDHRPEPKCGLATLQEPQIPLGAGSPAASGPIRVDPDNPPIAAIRGLLIDAFTPQKLRSFCQDRPQFQDLVNHFGPGYGLDDMASEVIDYCRTQLLWDELLAEIAVVNPRQYARFEPRLRGRGAGAATRPAPVRRAPGLSYLRQQLAGLDDAQLDAMCLDHFPEVYDRFGRGMRRDEKITLLLDHCRRDARELERLADLASR